jgi:hypothetical protein
MSHFEPFFNILANYSVSRPLARRMAAKRLKKLDARMARVSEDLVDILIIKGVISLNDLNPQVRRLMAERHSLRSLTKV